MTGSQKTPLYDSHVKLGGKMVEFAGWVMPVEYSGLRNEHKNVREQVGLFDVSHMGEIRFRGPKALESLEWLTTNFVGRLKAGQAQYSLLGNEKGGAVDDIIVYCLEPENDYLLCVNASNKEKDFNWVKDNNKGAEIIDESPSWGQIAVQGPKSKELMSLFFKEVEDLKYFHFAEVDFQGATCLLARTGYTGELGYEVFVPKEKTEDLWQGFMEKGQEFQIQPIGLGARDTLRLEMGYSLYGHELNDHTNPYQAGLGWVVKPEKKDFIGKSEILNQKEKGLEKKLVGFRMLERGIPRQGYKLFSFDNEEIGEVTSGTLSPTLGDSLGMAYIKAEHAEEQSEFLVQIRQKKLKAQVFSPPFVKSGGA